VVHVEDAAVALRAMVAALWLEHVAHEAVAPSFVLRIAVVEALKSKKLTQKGGT